MREQLGSADAAVVTHVVEDDRGRPDRKAALNQIVDSAYVRQVDALHSQPGARGLKAVTPRRVRVVHVGRLRVS